MPCGSLLLVRFGGIEREVICVGIVTDCGC